MKKILSLLFMLFVHSFSVVAQDNIQNVVQQKAYPKEGLQAFYENFIKELKVPDAPKGVYEINVRLKFIVEKDGSFSDIQVIDDKIGIQKEAVRVLGQMPAWEPAIHEGKNVRSAFTLPIKIKVKDPEPPVFSNRKQRNEFKDSLNNLLVDTEYFDLTCNCVLAKSSTNQQLQTEEFMIQAKDETAYYNVVFRKIDEEQAKAELQTIENDAEKQNAIVRTIDFNETKTTEVTFSMPDGNYVNHYRTLFLYKNNYLVAISIVSYKKQIADLLFEHLKEHFVFKI
ncbi:hypothetical protein NU10_10110 [Flavobacterium dauae]|uniref:energy transducer TonB n=1 Tax=Flavobacterium dauae TaxID=1563479 RepID=UPI00101B4B39|nr:hypothetical protein [Flavobacterium dauae]WLD23062.1 hypothetical protein NU10_10110 [Flavobacterium dauae]